MNERARHSAGPPPSRLHLRGTLPDEGDEPIARARPTRLQDAQVSTLVALERQRDRLDAREFRVLCELVACWVARQFRDHLDDELRRAA